MTDTSIQYIVICQGLVLSRPRIVRRRYRQTPTKLFEFSYKFSEYGESLPDMESDITLRKYEYMIKSLLESEGIYTDKNGAIKHFHPPEGDIWWMELTGVGAKELRHNKEPEAPIPDGPTIEGVLEKVPEILPDKVEA